MKNSEAPGREKRPGKSARHRAMDLIARRDHSEKELRKKLAERDHSPEEIEDALDYVRTNGWMPEPEVMAEKFAGSMGRRNKGIRSINQKLVKMGLPTIKGDAEQELEKALRLAETKLSGEGKPDRATREKIGRFLLARGFESSIVRKVIYEKL